MRRYIISYDLYRPGNNYSDLTADIKRLGEDWEHPLANLWIVETDFSAAEIRQLLSHQLITGDKLYICEAGEDMAAMDIAPGSPVVQDVTNDRFCIDGIIHRLANGAFLPRHVGIRKPLRQSTEATDRRPVAFNVNHAQSGSLE
jgi:hypothetical protein